MSVNESGFELLLPHQTMVNQALSDLAVQVLVTTQGHNIRKLDPSIHRNLSNDNSQQIQMVILLLHLKSFKSDHFLVDARTCQLSLASIRHARWFEDNATHST